MTFNREDLLKVMEVFQAESNEHIQNLNAGFLKLEKDPTHAALIDEAFREAHSIKGAARMMGFATVENIAHKLETVLSMARRGELDLDSKTIEPLYHGLDAMTHLVQGLARGECEDKLHVSSAIESLTAIIEGKNPSQPCSPPSAPAGSNHPPEASGLESWERRQATVLDGRMVGRRQSDVLLHETIRVATQRLDALMNQVGELLTIRIKSGRRLAEVQAALEYVDEWSRHWQAQKRHIARLRKANGGREMQPFLNFLGENAEGLRAISESLGDLYRNLREDDLRLSLVVDQLEDSVKQTRMMPFSVITEAFPRMVRDLAKESGKEVEFVVDGAETELDRKVLELVKDPLIHMVRNAIDHGIELPAERSKAGKRRAGLVTVRAIQRGKAVAIEVEDDGSGLDTQLIRETAVHKGLFREQELSDMSEAQIWNFIFAPGFTTSRLITNVSGRGVGMDIARSNVEKLKGLIKLESERGVGTRFTMALPLTLATTQILLVETRGTTYALPTSIVETTTKVNPKDIFTVSGRAAMNHNGLAIALARLDDALGLPRPKETDIPASLPVVIVGSAEQRIAFTVDRLVGEEQVVVKSLGYYLRRVQNVAGATVLGDGRICLILDAADLIRSARSQRAPMSLQPKPQTKGRPARRVLVVDDSITTRTLEKSILESAGFRVTTASDGLDAFLKLRNSSFDVIISDVQMPNMDGFELAAKVRSDPQLKDTPVILVTSLESDEDRRKGIEVGANAYLTKSTFDQENLLETIRRL